MVSKYIKLKETIYLLNSGGNDKNLLLYDSIDEKVFIKINIETIQGFSLHELKEIMYSYNRIERIVRTPYASVILQLYKNYTSLFLETDQEEELLENKMDYDIKNSIDFNNFYSTYTYNPSSFKEKEICLFGGSVLNLLVVDYAVKMGIKIDLYISPSESVEPLECFSFSGRIGQTKLSALSNMYELNQNVTIKSVDQFFQQGQGPNEHVFSIVCHNSFDKEIRESLVRKLEAQEGNKVLHYGMYEKNLVIGPFVVAKKTYHYGDFDLFSGTFSQFTIPLIHIGFGILLRILHFVLADTLKHLWEDSQLPINSTMVIDKYSLNGGIQTKLAEVMT